MKKLIIALGIFLMSASAFADHTTGLKQHRAQNHYGSSIAISGGAIITPKGSLFLNRHSANQPNIITDPVSCVEKWGDACLETDDGIETPQLDLGEINVIEHLVTTETAITEEPVDVIMPVEKPVSETIE